jgi:hypothetical protein
MRRDWTKKRKLLDISWLKCLTQVGRVVTRSNESGSVLSVAGAFTPLWSAVGGLLGPAFMPGFRRDRKPKRASPKATIPAASCRARDHPRIDSASSTDRLCGYVVPRPSFKGACHQPVLKHGPKRQKGRERPSARIDKSLITNVNSVPLPTINREEPQKEGGVRIGFHDRHAPDGLPGLRMTCHAGR